MTAVASLSIVIDPGDDLPHALSRIEDWLRFADVESDDDDEVVSAAVDAIDTIAASLYVARRVAPQLRTPDGRSQLAPLYVLSVDLAAMTSAIRQAQELVGRVGEPVEAEEAICLLERCARFEPDGALRVLARAASKRDARVDLDYVEYHAYGRLVRATLANPLDRFLALPCDCVWPRVGEAPTSGLDS